jgi:hypothetical protein
MILRRLLAAGSAVAACCSLAAPATAADIGALLSSAGSAAESGEHAAAVEALEQALERVRIEAPLLVNPFLVVARPADFYGDYAPREDAVFRSGEPLYFYMEPKNLVAMRTEASTYEPAFEVDLEVLDADGQSIGSQDKFASFRLPTKSAVHDIFLNLEVTLSGAPPGKYGVRFVVRDLNSNKTTTVTQSITVQ